MAAPKQNYYDKRSQVLVKNLQSRGFEAYYCQDKTQALEKALTLIPEGSTVGAAACPPSRSVSSMPSRREITRPLTGMTSRLPRERPGL